MTKAEREALMHMLLAQREQINASLRILAGEPEPQEPQQPRRPRYMGDDEPAPGAGT